MMMMTNQIYGHFHYYYDYYCCGYYSIVLISIICAINIIVIMTSFIIIAIIIMVFVIIFGVIYLMAVISSRTIFININFIGSIILLLFLSTLPFCYVFNYLLHQVLTYIIDFILLKFICLFGVYLQTYLSFIYLFSLNNLFYLFN